jgi:hypothetical protein
MFGAFLAVLFRNPAPAIGLGLVWTIIIEGAIQVFGFTTPVLAAALNWLPGANTASLAATFWTHATTLAAPVTMQGDPSQLGQGPASGDVVTFTLVLRGYLVVFVASGALLVRKRDVV